MENVATIIVLLAIVTAFAELTDEIRILKGTTAQRLQMTDRIGKIKCLNKIKDIMD